MGAHSSSGLGMRSTVPLGLQGCRETLLFSTGPTERAVGCWPASPAKDKEGFALGLRPGQLALDEVPSSGEW